MGVKIFKNTTGDENFYKKMGKYFAEPEYKDELPYIKNKDNYIWFINFNDNNEIINFMAIEELKNKIKLHHIFTEKEYRDDGYFKQLNNKIFKYIKENLSNKPIELATKNNIIFMFYKNKGFKVYRETKNYYFMRKEVDK
ncbi:MAG: GNAT family N-acetyltransferase [Halanaerobiales bacterium]|nr:GNAT family N-acetyltransferase [Halanaerobiales bacterium]